MASKVIANLEVVVNGKNISVVQKEVGKLNKTVDQTSKSTKEGGKQVDAYGRKIKGAAGISSNATKNFSKMQQNVGGNDGAGGLVRAYALLAANVFALTAAFGVLQRSAQIDQLTTSMEILSTRGGTSIDVLSAKIVDASGGAIALADAFRQVSLASSAGLNTQEIEGLTMVARGAAISLGRDLPDAMDRIFRGAIKLEPEILDEIGLFVRVDEAARDYARSLGRTVTSLSQADKRQAFLNAILEQGTKKFQEYAEAVEPDAFTQLAAALRDIAQDTTSLLNKVIGPFVSFLADNKGLLTGLFLVVAGTLLKQAIPAIGQFNQQVAEGAALAQSEAAEYVKGVERKASGALKSQRKIENANKKAAKSAAQLTASEREGSKLFKSQAKGAKDLESNIQKATTASKRKEAIDKKAVQLRQSLTKVQEKSKKLIENELRLLQKESDELEQQIRAEKELNKLRKGAKTQPGTLADRTGQQLAQTAAVAGGVSMVSGIAETQGLTSGFRELGDVLKKGEVTVDGTTTKLKGLSKASFAVRGAFSLLAVGISSFMAAATPFLIVGAAIGAVLFAIGKAAGVGREESKKLGETIKNTEKITSKLTQRYAAQVKGVNDTTITYIEQIKALTAFNKQANEAGNQIVAISKDLAEFEATANSVTNAWQAFLSIFGLDKESQAVQQQLALLNKTLIAAFDLGDTDLADSILTAAGATDEYKNALLEVENATGKITSADEAYKAAQDRGIKNIERVNFLYRSYNGNLDDAAKANKSNSQFLAQFTQEELKAIGSRAKYSKVLEKSNKILDDAEFSQDNLNAAAERDILITNERSKRLQSFTSSIEGAKESIGKFQQAFLPRTKVDEVIGSLDGIEESFKNLTKEIIDPKTGESVLTTAIDPAKVKQFLGAFKDADNPLSSLFTPQEIKEIEALLEAGETTKAAAKISKVTDEFYEFQMTVLTSKQAITKLNSEIKQFSAATAKGANTGSQIFTKQVQIKQEELDIAKANLQANIRSLRLEEDQAKKVKEAVDSSKTHAELKQKIVELGISEASAMSLAAAFDAEQTKALEKQILEKQKIHLITQAELQANQKLLQANESLVKAQIKQDQLRQRALGARTGITDTAGNVAQDLEGARKEVELQQKNFELQAKLQEIEFKIIEAQLEVLEERGIITEKELKNYKDNISAAIKDSAEALRIAAANAGQEFSNKIAETVSGKGAGKEGITGLAKRLAAAEKEKQNRIDALESERDNPETDSNRRKQIEEELRAINALNLGYIGFKETLRAAGEQMKKFGPEGEYAAAVVIGSANILDGLDQMRISFEENSGAMERGAAVAEFASTALANISQMMQANSQAQIAAVDQQIAAEKKRDGKSKESIAKINALEKKKEAIARKNFEQQKKMQMAQAVMSTAAAIMQTAASNLGAPWAFPLMAAMAAMGAMQLAVISKQKYNGPQAEQASVNATSLSIGKKSNAVDVAKQATGGELNYLRGGRTTGQNLGGAGASFPGGAMGRRGYANGGEGIMVGERGPEVISPASPVDITPNFALGGGETNVNFTINAVDAAGVEDVLMNQRGNLIRMIREAANENGERFLETIDTQSYGSST